MSLNLSDPSLLQRQAYIDGEWVDADDGATMPVKNPATGEVIIEIAKVGAEETDHIIWRKGVGAQVGATLCCQELTAAFFTSTGPRAACG